MENGSAQTQHNKQNNIQHNKNEDSKVLDQLAPKVSIQDAFKKFQKEKFYQLKLNKFLKNVKVDRSSPEFKQQLRQKFIETAKKYIGVPYAQKYHKPGDELYSAPLFLDCCALIRQVVFDLRQQFCYTLGKWNQSYQFDLLPNEGLQQKDAKPGDLIFYSAEYYDKRLKPFPHHMVHVEIYMGEGKSIGSRWQKGVIQIFDSYKFESKLYHSIQYHFRSLDSWLEGKFQSHCKQHKWLDDRNGEWLSQKFSVFADPSLDDMNITKNEGQAECRKVMVGKGNNNKLIRQYFKKLSYQNQAKNSGPSYIQMQQKDQFSPHFFYKWVQSPSQVDFYSFKQGEQIVNHIPNIMLVLASKLELLKTLQQFQLDAETKGYPLTLKVDDFIPKTYRLDVMSDEISFINHKSQGIWIYKPRNLNQGRGIKMIANIQEFKKQFIKSKKFYLGQYSLNNMLYYKPDLLENQPEQPSTSQNYKDFKHDGLIQQYIKPLLIDNRKFDIRCYLFVNSDPNIVLFHPGYLRLTIQKYDEDNIQDQNKLMVHLTNNCYQHKHKEYKEKKETSIGRWEDIVKEIGKEKTEELVKQMKRILLVTYAAAHKKLMRKKGTYQLLGCDFLVDKDLKPYLLQVNTNPALFTDTKIQSEIIPQVVKNSLDIVLGVYDDKDGDNLLKIESNPQNYGFQLIYSEKSKIAFNMNEETKYIVDKDGIRLLNGLELGLKQEIKGQATQQKQKLQ